jgi:hypothetical protein
MKTLIRIAGVVNLCLARFPCPSCLLHLQDAGHPAEPLALMKMLNAAAIGTFLVLGLSMTFYAEEVASARIGRLLLALGAAISSCARRAKSAHAQPEAADRGHCPRRGARPHLALLRACRAACACSASAASNPLPFSAQRKTPSGYTAGFCVNWF